MAGASIGRSARAAFPGRNGELAFSSATADNPGLRPFTVSAAGGEPSLLVRTPWDVLDAQ